MSRRERPIRLRPGPPPARPAWHLCAALRKVRGYWIRCGSAEHVLLVGGKGMCRRCYAEALRWGCEWARRVVRVLPPTRRPKRRRRHREVCA